MPSKSLTKSESINIKIENLDKTSGKCSSRKGSWNIDNYQSEKTIVMNWLNKENLFPNSIETRWVPTPRSRGMRKYVRILSKIHQMRFMLIQKLKDSKILFEIIDENFNSRARINSLKVTNNKMNSEYKTNRMYDIFKPTISDLTDGYGPLEDSEIQPTSRSKAR